MRYHFGMNTPSITVSTTIQAPIATVWARYTLPEHFMQWNQSPGIWHTPSAENDLQVGGRFIYRQEFLDSGNGDYFSGIYTDVKVHEYIAYTMDDDRKVIVRFTPHRQTTTVTIQFEAELILMAPTWNERDLDVQRDSWQWMLDTFKRYAER